MARSYVADLPGGTATTTIQCQAKQTFTQLVLTVLNAAAGKVEVSSSPASQIGTAQPTSDVWARFNVSAGTAASVSMPIRMDIKQTVNPFENVYIHQTGAGNLGTIVIS